MKSKQSETAVVLSNTRWKRIIDSEVLILIKARSKEAALIAGKVVSLNNSAAGRIKLELEYNRRMGRPKTRIVEMEMA